MRKLKLREVKWLVQGIQVRNYKFEFSPRSVWHQICCILITLLLIFHMSIVRDEIMCYEQMLEVTIKCELLILIFETQNPRNVQENSFSCWRVNAAHLCSSRWLSGELLIFLHKVLLLLFSHSVMSDSLWSHELQHTRLSCPSLSPRVCSNSCPLSQCCQLSIR